jgi:membrane protease YdiL (CAAX protease family)
MSTPTPHVEGHVSPGFEAVRDAFVANFDSRGELGGACCAYSRGQQVVDLWGGIRNKETSEPWKRDTMVIVYSATKGLAAMTLALAHSRGWIDYDERVCTYWPEFAQRGKERITVRQLLAHQAGLFALNPPVDRGVVADLDRLAIVLARQRPAWPPGTRQAYLLCRTLRARVARRWHAVALLTAPLLWIATLAALSAISPAFVPGIVTGTDRMELVLFGIAVGLAAGVFEEIGWTGFAIPHVRRRYGVVATGLIVGVVWGAWHLLTNVFWVAGATSGNLPLSIFVPASVIGMLVGYLAAFRVLMVWLYEGTGSVLLAMVMHASLTASVLILDPAGLTGTALLTYAFALASVVWAAAALVFARSDRHRAQPTLTETRRAA